MPSQEDLDSRLDSILGSPPAITQEEEKIPTEVIVHQSPPIPSNPDADTVREVYLDIMDKNQVAMENLLKIADESQHPRAYEVYSTLMKNAADVAEKLIVLQKQRKELTGELDKPNNVTIEKAVFVGTASELLKKVKNESNNQT